MQANVMASLTMKMWATNLILGKPRGTGKMEENFYLKSCFARRSRLCRMRQTNQLTIVLGGYGVCR